MTIHLDGTTVTVVIVAFLIIVPLIAMHVRERRQATRDDAFGVVRGGTNKRRVKS